MSNHGLPMLTTLWRDLRLACRVLAKRKTVAIATIATLGGAIGVATAAFSTVDGVILKPLPVADQDRLVALWGRDRADSSRRLPLPFATYRAFAESQPSRFGEVAALNYAGAFPEPLRDGVEAINLNVAAITGNLFRVLGVSTIHGRGLQPDDDQAGAASVMVISHGLWQRRYGADPTILGRVVHLKGRATTIVGIMPRGFAIPADTDLWVTAQPFFTDERTKSPDLYVSLVGRLAPEATVDQSRTEFSAFLASDHALLPPVLGATTGSAEPLDDYLLEGIRPLIWTLVAAVALLTLIAIVNVGALFVGYGAGRVQEFAVRRSLGATAGRIIRQLITEAMVLAAACTVAGITLANALVALLTALAPAELPRADAILVDWRAAAIGSAIALGAAIGFGLVAALVPLRLDLTTPLRRALHRESTGGRLAERALVVIQIALALVVLGGAGLVVRSLANLQQLNWGVSANEVLIAQLVPSDRRESQDVALYNRRLDDLLNAVMAIPGVVSAAPILMPPFGGTAGWDARFLLEGQAEQEQSRQPLLNFEIATPEYFRTMGIQLIRGRTFTHDDRADAPPVIIVSESVARMAWPNTDPVGRRIKISGSPWSTVIGVAADTRYRQLTRLRPTVYRPRAQFPTTPGYLAVRASSALHGVVEPLRGAGQSAWPGVFFPSVRALHDYGAEPLARPRFAALLLSGLAAASLVWAVIGLYGVMSTFVLRRKREIGIRMALGSERARALRSIIREGMLLALGGVALGTALAMTTSRLMTALLFDVTPADPPTFATVAAVVVVASLLATYLPARQAASVDPAVILRE